VLRKTKMTLPRQRKVRTTYEGRCKRCDRIDPGEKKPAEYKLPKALTGTKGKTKTAKTRQKNCVPQNFVAGA